MEPLRLLFWNVGRSASLASVGDLVRDHNPDVVILAECDRAEIDGLFAINSVATRLYSSPFNLSDRLQFYVALPADNLEPVLDDFGIAIRRVRPVVAQDFILVAVHANSKMFLSAEEQSHLTTRIREAITEAETKIGHQRTVLLGDLNMDPFDGGVVSSEGLHAISSRIVAARLHRTVLGRQRLFFYNPMWSLLGDESPGPPGTYYYDSSSPVNHYWHTFDQVLLRPVFADHFEPGDVAVLPTAGGVSLLSDKGMPRKSVSDHLPILATIRLQEADYDHTKLVG